MTATTPPSCGCLPARLELTAMPVCGFCLMPMQDDAHFTTVLRYVERNPTRAKLVTRAEQWRWSSLGQKESAEPEPTPLIPLSQWPVVRRADWVSWVNQPQTPAEEAALRHCLKHGPLFGDEDWTMKMEKKLQLGPPRDRGRPKKTVISS